MDSLQFDPYAITRWFRALRAQLRNQRQPMRIEGACKMRGNCCRNLILVDRGRPLASLRRFRRLARRETQFEMFVPHDKEFEDGLLRFSCRNLGGDGRCQSYSERPDFCREYPVAEMFEVGGELLPGCGYRVVRGGSPVVPFAAVFERALGRRIPAASKAPTRAGPQV